MTEKKHYLARSRACIATAASSKFRSVAVSTPTIGSAILAVKYDGQSIA